MVSHNGQVSMHGRTQDKLYRAFVEIKKCTIPLCTVIYPLGGPSATEWALSAWGGGGGIQWYTPCQPHCQVLPSLCMGHCFGRGPRGLWLGLSLILYSWGLVRGRACISVWIVLVGRYTCLLFWVLDIGIILYRLDYVYIRSVNPCLISKFSLISERSYVRLKISISDKGYQRYKAQYWCPPMPLDADAHFLNIHWA
jgi:hypothetical protein